MSFTNSFVSLAACSTFDALYQGAEKYTGLPEAFFSSGANGLIITMWNIENLSASEFNKRTLEKVFRQKKNFAEAIQETSREFIKSEDYNHPYFWGPFIYLGKN